MCSASAWVVCFVRLTVTFVKEGSEGWIWIPRREESSEHAFAQGRQGVDTYSEM